MPLPITVQQVLKRPGYYKLIVWGRGYVAVEVTEDGKIHQLKKLGRQQFIRDGVLSDDQWLTTSPTFSGPFTTKEL